MICSRYLTNGYSVAVDKPPASESPRVAVLRPHGQVSHGTSYKIQNRINPGAIRS